MTRVDRGVLIIAGLLAAGLVAGGAWRELPAVLVLVGFYAAYRWMWATGRRRADETGRRLGLARTPQERLERQLKQWHEPTWWCIYCKTEVDRDATHCPGCRKAIWLVPEATMATHAHARRRTDVWKALKGEDAVEF